MYTKEQIIRAERWFPISRDPPEGGTLKYPLSSYVPLSARFQFLGIPPKGELSIDGSTVLCAYYFSFQFLGIPPKGEQV